MIKKLHLQCCAKTRKGTPCRCKILLGGNRCKFHGGMSTGPLTVNGKKQAAKNIEKGREVIARQSPEWFHQRSKKAAATRKMRAKYRAYRANRLSV